jgi:exopolysaccharide biosynthesis polyprenyl glycosylphosphotransferase
VVHGGSVGGTAVASPQPGNDDGLDETSVRPDRRWQRVYARQLACLDAAAIISAVSIALVVRFGQSVDSSLASGVGRGVTYLTAAIVLCLLWSASLAVQRSYEGQIIGGGPEEYRRVFRASAWLWASVAVAAYVTKTDFARGFVAIAFPLGTALIFLSRWWSRRWLARLRASKDTWSHRVLILGDAAHVGHLIAELRRSPGAGYAVVGVCMPGGLGQSDVDGVPVVGSLTTVVHAIDTMSADTVAVTATPGITAPILRRLAWELEQRDVDMVLAPALTDVAGPRIHVQPIAGLPLLHVAQPEFTGPRRIIKSTFDRGTAVLAVLLLSPLLLVIAVIVKVTDRGAVLFRQTRVGRTGEEFCAYKFRSMVVDAEHRLTDLQRANQGAGVLFKMRDDPRVTRIGRALRRYSLDELPQLFNVIKGDMSLVGPRPPLPAEVAQYPAEMRRRLLVKPGITGLWQVSGRSDLSWDESVRLDLYYVENWSLTSDLIILWRTVKAVIRGSGAY